jgi:tetratricopeptide (TPR) repeat protein
VSRHFNAGIDAYTRQDYRAAIAAFDAVLELDAQHREAASYREQARNSHEVRVRSALDQARTRLEAGDFDGARLHVRRVVEMEPDHGQARQLSANIERAAGAAWREAQRQRQAQRENQAAARRDEDSAPRLATAEIRARYDSGMQQYRSGNLMTAMQTWEEVAHLAPHFGEVDKYLLRVYRVTGLESYTEGRLRDAVDIWEKALQLEPENAQLRRYLNRAHAKLLRAQSVDPRR